MAASRDDIQHWIARGLKEKASHLIVVCDTYDYEDYPVYATSDEDVLKKFDAHQLVNMQRVMEVYDLRIDIQPQLNEHRAMHLPKRI